MNYVVKMLLAGTLAITSATFFQACSESEPSGSESVGLSEEQNTSSALMSADELASFNAQWKDYLIKVDSPCEIDGSCEEEQICEDDTCEEEIVYPRMAISANRIKLSGDADRYEICYSKEESPESEPVNVCPAKLDGSDLPVKFYMIEGSTFANSGYVLEYGKVCFGGIDLTGNVVVVDKSKMKLPAVGRYTLMIQVDDHLKKLASFRQSVEEDSEL